MKRRRSQRNINSRNTNPNKSLNLPSEPTADITHFLANELWVLILSYLNFIDLVSVGLVSKAFQTLANEQSLWKILVGVYFPESLKNLPNTSNDYKKIFLEAYNECDKHFLFLLTAARNWFYKDLLDKVSFYQLTDFHSRTLGTVNFEKTIIQVASLNKNQSFLDFIYNTVIKKLRSKLEDSQLDETGRNIVHWMALCNQLKEYSQLKDNCHLAVVKDIGSMTALQLAAHCGHADFLSAINKSMPKSKVAKKAFTNALRLTKDHCSILHLAIESGDVETFQLLCQWKLYFNTRHHYPLHFAIEAQQIAMVNFFLAQQKEIINIRLQKTVFFKNHFGDVTVLDCALITGNIALVKLLLEKGASFKKRGQRLYNCSRALAEFLLDVVEEKSELAKELMVDAIDYGNLALWNLVEQKNMLDPNYQIRGSTLLEYAVTQWCVGSRYTNPSRKELIEKILKMTSTDKTIKDRNSKILKFVFEKTYQMPKKAAPYIEELLALLESNKKTITLPPAQDTPLANDNASQSSVNTLSHTPFNYQFFSMDSQPSLFEEEMFVKKIQDKKRKTTESSEDEQEKENLKKPKFSNDLLIQEEFSPSSNENTEKFIVAPKAKVESAEPFSLLQFLQSKNYKPSTPPSSQTVPESETFSNTSEKIKEEGKDPISLAETALNKLKK